jgi:parallel beta-helix repeat protein
VLAGNDQAIALVGGRDTLIGGAFPSHRNLIGSSSDVGVLITQFIGLGGEGITIRNNLIGSDKDGLGSLPNGDGIRISGPGNTVLENVIAGNTRDGIVIAGSNARGNTIVDNNIGGNLDLVTFLQGNGRMGIMVENGASLNVIGPGNRVGRNGDDGIRIFADAGRSNRITGNLAALNDAMGIDIGANGVTANDNDPVSCAISSACAANRGQNYPVLSEAERKTQGLIPINTPVRIRGTLRSVVGGPYRIEIFVSPGCDTERALLPGWRTDLHPVQQRQLHQGLLGVGAGTRARNRRCRHDDGDFARGRHQRVLRLRASDARAPSRRIVQERLRAHDRRHLSGRLHAGRESGLLPMARASPAGVWAGRRRASSQPRQAIVGGDNAARRPSGPARRCGSKPH